MDMSNQKDFYPKSGTCFPFSEEKRNDIHNDCHCKKNDQLFEVTLPPETFISQVDRNIGSCKLFSPGNQTSSSSNNWIYTNDRVFFAKSSNFEDMRLAYQRVETKNKSDKFNEPKLTSLDKEYYPIDCNKKKYPSQLELKASSPDKNKCKISQLLPNTLITLKMNQVKSKQETTDDSSLSLSDISSFSLGGNSDSSSEYDEPVEDVYISRRNMGKKLGYKEIQLNKTRKR